MEFQEFCKQKKRMCDSLKYCEECDLVKEEIVKIPETCSKNCMENPVVAEIIVQNWANEHPIKTNRMKFKEVFGEDADFNCCESWLNAEYKEP